MISYHETVNEMYERVREEELSNIADRYEAQKLKCSFCVQGLSCQLCTMGPCRLSDLNPFGACGLTKAGVAIRNFVHRNILGATAYTYHAIEAAKTLKATAEGKTPFEIKDVEKLKWFAELLGIDTNRDPREIAKEVADFVIKDLSSHERSKLVEVFAPKKRLEVWEKLALIPDGVFQEILTAATSAMTNVDSNYVSLAKKAMRMSISTILAAQLSLEVIQDILFGTPTPHEAYVDLGIIDPDYVNIVVNGHEPFVGMVLIKLAEREDVQKKAIEAGAKGLRIVGSIETGQEILQRVESPVFVGLTGNWITQEFLLATGAVDVFAADMNCTVPRIVDYQEKFKFKIVPVSKLIRLEGVDDGLDYEPEKVEEIAKKIIDLAIENFKERRKSVEPRVPKRKQKVLVGFSIEAILKALDNDLGKLVEAIKSGAIKGVVALVSCSTLKNGRQDENTVTVARELIKRDILVLSMGCGNAALQVAGLTSLEAVKEAGEGLRKVCETLNIPPVLSFGTCTDTGRLAYLVRVLADYLGVDVPQLPIAATAPEYMEQKATIDAIFAIAYGVTTHVSPVPPVTGSEDVVKLLTEDVEKLTGGKVIVEEDPIKAAEKIYEAIMEKRRELGLEVEVKTRK